MSEINDLKERIEKLEQDFKQVAKHDKHLIQCLEVFHKFDYSDGSSSPSVRFSDISCDDEKCVERRVRLQNVYDRIEALERKQYKVIVA